MIYLVMCVEPSGYHSDQSLDFYEAVLAFLEQNSKPQTEQYSLFYDGNICYNTYLHTCTNKRSKDQNF